MWQYFILKSIHEYVTQKTFVLKKLGFIFIELLTILGSMGNLHYYGVYVVHYQ